MPSEALELQIQDQLEIELSKIGTPSTLDWNTTTPPFLKFGVPGDPVPKPNKTAIYVQHVNSIMGDDSVGLALHMLHTVYHVWCVSTDPSNGLRQMLNLKEDVRRVLMAAEGTFYELFRYGLEMGPFTFSGDQAVIRGGTAVGVQEVHVRAHVAEPEVDDMTEAQVLALIHQELMTPGKYRLWDKLYVTPAQGPGVIPGRRTAGFTEQPFGYLRGISLPATANAIYEVVEQKYVTASAYSATQQEWIIQALINRGNENVAPAGNAFTGIELGSFGLNISPANWLTTIDGVGGGCIQMRYNHVSLKFELSVFLNNGEPAIVIEFPINPIFSPDLFQKEFKLHYRPSRVTGLDVTTIDCYLNGELMLSHTIPLQPDTHNPEAYELEFGAGYFFCKGSAATTLSETGFYDFRVYQPDFYDHPNPLNPV